MRLPRLLWADLKFLWRYGFGGLYALFTLLYLLLLAALPAGVRGTVCALLIFSDPAIMGLFFMGALLLLERSQRVLPALAVSPAAPWEYALSKALSLALVGTLVGGILAVFGGTGHLLATLCAVLLGALLFSFVGLIAAFYSGSLNQFLLLTVGAELLLCVPGMLSVFGWLPRWLFWHPGALVLAGMSGDSLALLLLIPWCALAFWLAERTAGCKMTDLGGVRL